VNGGDDVARHTTQDNYAHFLGVIRVDFFYLFSGK
jgi:hypothetical protein